MKLLDTVLSVCHNHATDIAAFSGGTILSIITWVHTTPEEATGKLIMAFAVGLVGGIGGITAKFICNLTTDLWKKRRKKNLKTSQKVGSTTYKGPRTQGD